MTTITISTGLIAKAMRLLDQVEPDMVFTASFAGEVSGVVLLLKDALAAPATAPDEVDRLRKDAERKPMTDEDTLALFNRIQLRMRFTDADARPFASGVASAEFFHGIK